MDQNPVIEQNEVENQQLTPLTPALPQKMLKELRENQPENSTSSRLGKIARERFELSSAGPKPAMLDHYTTGLQCRYSALKWRAFS